jgi:hypothetical protein
MSLPKHLLDDRTYAQLVAEGTAQINRLAPRWTNYNAADPGITLLELFAWLSEQNLYRTDRVPDEMVRGFLRLVEIEPAPPTVANTVVLLGTATAVALPDRVQVADPLGAAVFETREPVTVSAAHLVQLLSGADTLLDVTAANAAPYNPSLGATAGSFWPFGATAVPGAALYLGFDAALGSPGSPVSLHVWTIAPVADTATRAAVIREQSAIDTAANRDCPPELAALVTDWRHHYSVKTVWEFHGADGGWHPIEGVEDETRALTMSGFVRFPVPAGHASGGPGTGWFIRCRLVSGCFECATRLDRVGLNAVTAEHAASIDAPERLGTSQGHAWELYDTAMNPVVAGSTRLTLSHRAQTDTRWTEVANWDLTGPHDRNYLLQPELGRLTVGNGLRGAVIPTGWDLLLDYRVGGGIEGNIAAGRLTRLAPSGWNAARLPPGAAGVTVTQPIAAFGGAAAETLPAAEARAIEALAAPTRCVTLGDVVALARAVPGVPVARAAALPNTHPAVPCFTAPGCITVIVVPNCPGPAPAPGPSLLRAVARFLDRRRPVATEIHVIAPTYVTVTVAASLRVSSTTDPGPLPALAQQALDRFFNPLLGGPAGAGRPIGRAVYRTEIMALLAALPGVLTVTDLTLRAGDAAPVCGNIDICATDLVRSGQHQVTASLVGTTIFSRSRERECL